MFQTGGLELKNTLKKKNNNRVDFAAYELSQPT